MKDRVRREIKRGEWSEKRKVRGKRSGSFATESVDSRRSAGARSAIASGRLEKNRPSDEQAQEASLSSVAGKEAQARLGSKRKRRKLAARSAVIRKKLVRGVGSMLCGQAVVRRRRRRKRRGSLRLRKQAGRTATKKVSSGQKQSGAREPLRRGGSLSIGRALAKKALMAQQNKQSRSGESSKARWIRKFNQLIRRRRTKRRIKAVVVGKGVAAGNVAKGSGVNKKLRSHQGRRHFVRGKPLKGDRQVKKARVVGVYGCGKRRSKVRCRSFGVSERAVIGGRGNVVGGMERRIKRKIVMGPDRKRKVTEAIQKEFVRGTVRGMKMKRGLPVRGQRTSTNGKTARRLNRKRA